MCIVPTGTPSEHAFVCVSTRAAEDEDHETGAWLRSTAAHESDLGLGNDFHSSRHTHISKIELRHEHEHEAMQ
jgi:hypothetical protein